MPLLGETHNLPPGAEYDNRMTIPQADAGSSGLLNYDILNLVNV